MTDTAQFQEEKPDHHFRTEIPNIVYELRLKPGPLALYGYFKRIAGDGGSCFKKQSIICEDLDISKTTYIKYRDELEKSFELIGGKSLIKVFVRKKEDGSNDTTVVSIVDIWRENGDYFRSKNKVGHPENGRPPIQKMDDPIQNLDAEEEPSKKNPSEELFVANAPVGSPRHKIKVGGNGKEQDLTKDDVYLFATSKHQEWSIEDIEKAWNVIVEYGGVIHDWKRFIEGTIENFNKAIKSKRAARNSSSSDSKNEYHNRSMESCKKISQNQKNINNDSSDVGTSGRRSPTLVCLGDTMKRLSYGCENPKTS